MEGDGLEFKPATCPFCGGTLQVPPDRTSVKCIYCGKDIIVQQAIRAATGPIVENYMTLARNAKNAGNYKEAYDYYNKVLEIDNTNFEAWFGKGESAGWLSTLNDFRLPEMVSGIQNALQFIPEEKKEEIKVAGANVLNLVSTAFYKLAYEHLLEYTALDDTWNEFLNQCEWIIKALEIAHSFSPDDKVILDNIIHICKVQIEGVKYEDPYDLDFAGLSKDKIRRVSKSWESTLREKIGNYVDIRKKIEPTYKTPKIQKKSACFIVTATMGNNNHKYVILLQEFRDNWLLKRIMGKILIKKYYQYGPYLSDLIRNRRILRWLSYTLIVRPAVLIANKLLKK